eukprot:513680-Amphidinium_carterae.2
MSGVCTLFHPNGQEKRLALEKGENFDVIGFCAACCSWEDYKKTKQVTHLTMEEVELAKKAVMAIHLAQSLGQHYRRFFFTRAEHSPE